jgi:IS5 family transposase
VHDSVERDTLLLGDETALYADAAHNSKETRDKLEHLGIANQVQRKGYRNNHLLAEDSRRNDEIAVICTGSERPFATYKSRYGYPEQDLWGWPKI